MSKRLNTVSMYNPFPFVNKRDRADSAIQKIDEERKRAFKNIAPVEPKLSLAEQYLRSELGSLRDKWLKSKGWMRTVPRDPEILASYRNKDTQHKIRILKNQWIEEVSPDKTKTMHRSWKEFLETLKAAADSGAQS